jgi:hypothetical protein
VLHWKTRVLPTLVVTAVTLISAFGGAFGRHFGIFWD